MCFFQIDITSFGEFKRMTLSSPPLGRGLFITNKSFTGQANRALPGLDFWQIERCDLFIGFESLSKGR